MSRHRRRGKPHQPGGRLAPENDGKLIYPLSRQPLVLSETFLGECPQQRDFALVQTLYEFINDVVIFETEIVVRTARSIAKNRFAVAFPFACRYDAMTVVVDDAATPAQRGRADLRGHRRLIPFHASRYQPEKAVFSLHTPSL